VEPAAGAPHDPTRSAEGGDHAGLRAALSARDLAAPSGRTAQRSLPAADGRGQRGRVDPGSGLWLRHLQGGAGPGGSADAAERGAPHRAGAPKGQAATRHRPARPGSAESHQEAVAGSAGPTPPSRYLDGLLGATTRVADISTQVLYHPS